MTNSLHIVSFYLHEALKRRAQAGEHNFLNKFCSVLRRESFEIRFYDDDLAEQIKSKTRPGHAVFLMTEPTNDRGLTIRPNYFYPFWNIERTSKRWEWPVAKAQFDTASVPAEDAERFAKYWRKKRFPFATNTTSQDGFVYVPLQGRLLSHRSFQFCSPVEMIEYLLEHERSRNIVATLHPKEDYLDEEKIALRQLERRHPRLRISHHGMVSLLQRCDYVATQNSSVALSGYFFRKPAVLFGRIDFHHIAANVHDLGPKEAIARVMAQRPEYDAYLWWFFQKMSINAGKPDAEDKISTALKRIGWID